MKRIFNIKKILFIFTCIIVTFIISDYKIYYNEDVKEVSSLNTKKDNIVYKRIGSEKAIYDYNVKTKKLKKISSLLNEYSYVDNEIGILYDYENEVKGIYFSNMLNGKKELILKGYTLISDGKRFNKKVVFLAEGIYKKSSKLICIYNVEEKSLETKEIEAFKDSYIRDAVIMDNNNFMYSKKIKSVKESLYKSYSYNYKNDIESEIINDDSHVINPVLSNNKNKIAYIKKDINTYNLYLLDKKSGDKFTISLGEGVVAGSVKWSSNDKSLMCVTANKGYNDVLNIINVENSRVKRIANIYNAIFTANNKEIIGVGYNIDESLQEIYKINIDTNEKKVIHSFYEGGSFSRSVNIKEYNSF